MELLNYINTKLKIDPIELILNNYVSMPTLTYHIANSIEEIGDRYKIVGTTLLLKTPRDNHPKMYIYNGSNFEEIRLNGGISYGIT